MSREFDLGEEEQVEGSDGPEGQLVPGRSAIAAEIGVPRLRTARVPGKVTRTLPLAARIDRSPAGPLMVRPDAPDQLERARASAGLPLPEPLARRLEGALATDLSAVRIHTSAESAGAAAAIQARAYAEGQSIHFGAGQFAPGTPGGDRLIAHEVAHTVQQRDGTASGQISQPGDAHEDQADAFADAFSAGRPAPAVTPGPVSISRLLDDSAVSAREYFEKSSIKVAVAGTIMAKIRSQVHGSGSEWLTWDLAGEWHMVPAIMDAIAATGPTWEVLHQTMGQDPEIPIDAGRSVDNSGYGLIDNDRWVYDKIAERYVKVINESIHRLGPRIAAEWNRVVKNAGGPEPQIQCADPAVNRPDPNNILASHPIDRYVAAAMCTSELLSFDAEGYQRSHPDELGGAAPVQVRGGVHFEFDRGGGTWLMLRVIDPPDATPEEVAQELYGDTTFAYLLTPAGRFYSFRFPPSKTLHGWHDEDWHQKVSDDGLAPIDIIQGYNNYKDAERELVDSGNDDAILAHARDLPPTGADQAAIVQRFEVMISVVERMDYQAETFGMGGYLSVVHEHLTTRLTASQGSDLEAAKWDALSKEQQAILAGCASGLSQAWENATQTYGQTNAQGQVEGVGDVSQYLGKPLNLLAGHFIGAAQVSELVQVGRERLRAAQDRLLMYPADVMEATLLYVNDVMESLRDKSGYGYVVPGTRAPGFDGNQLKSDQLGLSNLVDALRWELVNDPAAAGKRMVELNRQIELLVFKATTGAALNTFEELLQTLDQYVDDEKFFDKRTKIDQVRNKWIAVSALIKRLDADDPKAVAEIRTKLSELQRDTDFQELISYVVDIVEDEQKKKRWRAIGMLIGILIVTVVSGGLAAGAVGGWAGVAAGALVEGLVFTTLTTMAFKDDFNGKDFVVELGINTVMFGGLRAVGRIFQIAAAGAKLGVGARVAKFTLENIILDAGMLTQAEYAKRRSSGKDLTASEVGDILLLNLVFTSAASVISRIGGSALRKYAEIKQLRALQDAIKAQNRALELAENARTVKDAIAAREAGKQMVAADRVAIEAEPKAIDELVAAAKSGEVKLSADEIKLLEELKADNLLIAEQREVSELMLRLEQKGPNDFVASAEDYAALRAKHTELNPAHPPVETGNKMVITPKPVDGMPSEPITIHKKVGTEATSIEPPDAVAPKNVNEQLGLRDWKRFKEERPNTRVKEKDFLDNYREGEFFNFETGKWRNRRVEAEADWKQLMKERPNWSGEPKARFIDRYVNQGDFWNFETGAWRNRLARDAPDPVYFPADVGGREALDLVMKSAAGGEGSFKAYYDMLVKYEIGGASETQVINAVESLQPGIGKPGPGGAPQGKSVDWVRHELKIRYRPQVLGHILDKIKLQAEFPDPRWGGTPLEQAAVLAETSHRKMLEVTKGLNEKDGSRISELWYEKAYPAEMQGAISQPKIPGNQGLKTADRQPDNALPVIEDANTGRFRPAEGADTSTYISHDIKLGKGDIDLAQLGDALKWVRTPGGYKVVIRGKEVLVVRHRLSFLNPEGVAEHAEHMRELLKNNPNFEVEIHNVLGQRQLVTRANLEALLEPGLSQWLRGGVP